MTEVLREILLYLPRYLSEFGSVLSGPKRFMERKNVSADKSFNDSILFLAVSVILTVVMTAPLLPPEKDLSMHIGGRAVQCLTAVSLSAIALRLSWRIVGGKAPTRSFFVTYAYYFGVIVVMFVLIMLLSRGILNIFDPEPYKENPEVESSSAPPTRFGGWAQWTSIAIIAAGYLLLAIWALVGWGAYRKLNRLSKTRSIVAFLVMSPLGLLVGLTVFFVGKAME